MTYLYDTLSANGWERSANERSAIENPHPQYPKPTKIVNFTVATHTTLDEISILQDNSCNRFMIFRKAYGATSSQLWLYNQCFAQRVRMDIPVEKIPTIRDILKGFRYSDPHSVQTKFSQNQSEILDMPLCVNTDSFKHPEIHIICDNELKMKEEQKKFTEDFRKKEEVLKQNEHDLNQREEAQEQAIELLYQSLKKREEALEESLKQRDDAMKQREEVLNQREEAQERAIELLYQSLKKREEALEEKEKKPTQLEETLKTVDEFIHSITKKLPKNDIIQYIEMYY
jgi:hypothetical protein